LTVDYPHKQSVNLIFRSGRIWDLEIIGFRLKIGWHHFGLDIEIGY
jgi:hypothetical protein